MLTLTITDLLSPQGVVAFTGLIGAITGLIWALRKPGPPSAGADNVPTNPPPAAKAG